MIAVTLHLPLFPVRTAACRFFALFVLGVMFVLQGSVLSRAQNADEAAKIVAGLPAPAQAVVARLSSLGELPDGGWKMHSGDMAHGEAVALDESGWKTIVNDPKAPEIKVEMGAIWFRRTIAVPVTLNGYDLTGARIWFQFHANANGPIPQILYFNGRRVAMGEDLEPVVLFDDAKPGDKVTIAIKLLHTVDEKSFRGSTMRIDFPATRPSPADLRTEFLSAAMLVPSLAPGDASKMTTLTEAIEAVDLKTLDAHDQDKFDESVMAAQHKLEALKPLLETATLHLTGNSHIDAAWLWPWTETVDVVKRTFGTALQLMYEYPHYTYTQSAAAYNEWMADKYPEMNAEIKKRIQEGRWEVVGGMWVEPDLNMPDGESLVRQLLVGKRWYKEHYGVDVRIGWNPDSFGYTWQLPQIYKKSGVDYFVTQKMTWNDTNQLPFKLFWWESPDGSKVLAYFPHDYANDNLNQTRLAEDMATARTRATGMAEMMDLYGTGDHGGGPTRAILDEGFHWTPEPGVAPVANATNTVHPTMQFGTAQPFFSSIEKQIAPQSKTWDYSSIAKGYTAPPAVPGKVSIPTWKSELYFEYHRGVMTTQANHKKNMRESSEQILNAEKWSSLAWLDGKSYPAAELTEDWKKVLFNQFHDLAAGSGIGVIYRDAQKDYDVVRWSTNEIKANSLRTVAEQIDTAGSGKDASTALVVFNPLAWERSGEVSVDVAGFSNGFILHDPKTATDWHSSNLPREMVDGLNKYRISVSDVPAMGYVTLQLTPECSGSACALPPINKSPGLKDEEGTFVLENAHLRVKIDKHNGCITSLYNLHDNFETLAGKACGNELQAFKDTPKDYDAWNIDPGTLDQPPTPITKADSVTLVPQQPGTNAMPAIRVTRTWKQSKFVQTISLDRFLNQVDVDNEIDWHESHILLKAAFPLAIQSDHATYEIPYGSIERTTKRTNSWEKAQFEVPAQQWADLGDDQHGLSLINDSKFGYDAAGNVLRLTLLRSPKWPDPDADMGHHHFHYALYPHAGTWQQAMTVRHGFEYNYPLQAVVTTAHPGTLPAAHSFVSVSPDNVVLTAVKKAEDANGLDQKALILRVYEWAGKAATVEFHVPPGATSATVTNMQETPEGDPLGVSGDVVKAPVKPFEILTIRVDYPGGPKS